MQTKTFSNPEGFSFASVGSGSKGNATLVKTNSTTLLIDCGFSATELLKRLPRLGMSGSDIDCIFLTHEHSDHSTGVVSLCRQLNIPLYASWGSSVALRERGAKLDTIELRHINCGERIKVGELDVLPVLVPHDAREPLQFVIQSNEQRFGILTDIGSISKHVIEHFQNVDSLLLEFNHDADMLRFGPYPASLKARVGGDWGHLSNAQAASFLEHIDLKRLQRILIAHISEKNNSFEAVEALLQPALQSAHAIECIYASQDKGSAWMPVLATNEYNAQETRFAALA
ncbi:MAG: MBL fold metallo-hydrolase [Pseudomonadales bacterium]